MPTTASYTNVTGPLHVLLTHGDEPESATVAEWWAALEPAILALTVAGYDCPEIALGRWDVTDQYLRLLAFRGRVEGASTDVLMQSGDWRSLFPVVGDDTGKIRFALRVEARRFVEQPVGRASPYPPLPLAGVVTGYKPGPPTPTPAHDPFATAFDGWIVGVQVLGTHVGVDGSTIATGRLLRDQVTDALSAALTPPASGPVGLVSCLDPAGWDVPLAAALPVDSFSDVAATIWSWLSRPANLKGVLGLELGDKNAAGGTLLRKAQASDTAGAWSNPRDQLDARQRYFYPREQNVANLIKRLQDEHWLILLFTLHEYGLIRILPFAVTDPTLLPAAVMLGDLPPTDLTGLYETRWGLLGDDRPDSVAAADGTLVNATLQINHAGAYLDGWMTDSELVRDDYTAALDVTTFQPSAGVQQPLLRFKGRFGADTTTWIEIFDVPYPDDGFADLAISVSFDDGARHRPTTR